jgi:hypothetical protein
MISELLRPLVRFLFWNRRRPIIALAALLILAGIMARLAGCAAAPAHSVQARAAATASPAIPAPSSSPSGSQPAPSPAPGGQALGPGAAAGPVPAQALQAASEFMAAWVSRGPGRDARIRACATAQLTAAVTGPGAGYAPATAITGPLVVTGQAAGTVSLTAPTNAGPALLTVRLSRGRWVAAQLMLEKSGD